MYRKFFQLKENPFSITADPDFFFSSPCHREAIANLTFGIEQRKGIVVITGEVGTGKTTLCRKLLKQTGRKTKFALILNSKLSGLQLLQMIAHDLGISVRRKKDELDLIQAFNKFLLKQANKGNNVVVMIDESQNLTIEQLEQVRLLSNLETAKEKLLQIILIGQPELHEKLQLPELRQLRQRIAVYFHMRPLDKNEIKSYIHHRLQKAARYRDVAPNVAFTDEAIDVVYHYTQGSPRTINILCDRALLAGFAENTRWINDTLIHHCAKEILYCEHHLPSTTENTTES